MSRPVCGNCMCLEDETGCGCVEMKQEPVAWIPKGMELAKPKDLTNCIPLYTEPQYRELSDDEIEKCYWGDGYPDNPRHPKEFAKAILRKAQEK